MGFVVYRAQPILYVMTQKKRNVEPGTPKVDSKYSIVIDRKGPYFVYGQPPLKQESFMPNEEGSHGNMFPEKIIRRPDEPTALCRCGASNISLIVTEPM